MASSLGETEPTVRLTVFEIHPVPEGPGRGFELNLDVVRENLVPWDKRFFEPTPERGAGGPRSHDRL
ncbi:MAG: hypothetical protein H0T91_01015 [Propionibacteriaceae bacterium]|nr:hypothetical protein [Propionibacteriaceae bacterium]